jgi:hypothetical protein
MVHESCLPLLTVVEPREKIPGEEAARQGNGDEKNVSLSYSW